MLMIGALLHSWEQGLPKVILMFAGGVAISAALGLFLEPLRIPLRGRLLKLFGSKASAQPASLVTAG
jgi:hypothetical protein